MTRAGTEASYTFAAVKMEGANPSRAPKTLWTFHSQEELSQYVLGCDADIGGTSTCNMTMGEDGKAKFWGDMRLAVKPGLEKKIRGGYAGFRNRVSSLHEDFVFRC